MNVSLLNHGQFLNIIVTLLEMVEGKTIEEGLVYTVVHSPPALLLDYRPLI